MSGGLEFLESVGMRTGGILLLAKDLDGLCWCRRHGDCDGKNVFLFGRSGLNFCPWVSKICVWRGKRDGASGVTWISLRFWVYGWGGQG